MSVAEAATVAAALLAAASLLGPTRALYARTVGRRADLYRRFDRLGVGAHQDFFDAVLGEGPTIRRSINFALPDWYATGDGQEPPLIPHRFTESLWVDPLFYAQSVADADGSVLGFSITTRSKRFAPRFAAPRPVPTRAWVWSKITRQHLPALAHVRLGRSKFSEVVRQADWLPSVRCLMGARKYAYSEAWSFGNPGFYADYICTLSDISSVGGYHHEFRPLGWPVDEEDETERYDAPDPEGNPVLAPWIRRVRSTAVVNTWTVIQFPLGSDRWPPENFGPHGDEVRTLA